MNESLRSEVWSFFNVNSGEKESDQRRRRVNHPILEHCTSCEFPEVVGEEEGEMGKKDRKQERQTEGQGRTDMGLG